MKFSIVVVLIAFCVSSVVGVQSEAKTLAVTQSGSRCKCDKAGMNKYCKQHPANVKVNLSPAQSRDMTYEGA